MKSFVFLISYRDSKIYLTKIVFTNSSEKTDRSYLPAKNEDEKNLDDPDKGYSDDENKYCFGLFLDLF